jgi:hypothetical protein
MSNFIQNVVIIGVCFYLLLIDINRANTSQGGGNLGSHILKSVIAAGKFKRYHRPAW